VSASVSSFRFASIRRRPEVGVRLTYRPAVAEDGAMGEVVRNSLRELLPAVAESLTPPEGADLSVLGASAPMSFARSPWTASPAG